MCITFLLGYIGIVFENFFEFNKAGIALLMSTALWVIYAGEMYTCILLITIMCVLFENAFLLSFLGASGGAMNGALSQLSEKVSEVSEVVFFILGAMAIVEIVDAHQGFKVITDKINSKSKRGEPKHVSSFFLLFSEELRFVGLMRVLGALTFFMSAILDNLTTTIVMVSLVKKILPNPMDRKLFGAMIVIAGP